MGARGRPRCGRRRAGSGLERKSGRRLQLRGPPGAAFAARSGVRLGPPVSKPGPFISRGAGGPSPAAEAAEPRGAAPALPHRLPPPGPQSARAARACRRRRRRKPGTPQPGAEPGACGGPSARASFVRSAPAARGPGGGARGAERFGEARPCPTPGERKFPLPPLSCDSTLPPRPGVRVRVQCVGCTNAAVSSSLRCIVRGNALEFGRGEDTYPF